MTATAGAVVGLLVLIAVLAFAVARPRGLPEAVAAVPAAGLVLALGLVTPARAGRTLAEFAPTLAFLAAILALAGLADAEGVFRWVGAAIARRATAPLRLFGAVFVAAAATTVVLSLDATVVLLTPAVIAAARRARMRPAPALYVTAHLTNSASLLLPVSNLTNLLAFPSAGLTFWRFGALMALPFAACLAVEYVAFRFLFAADLRTDAAAEPVTDTLGDGDLGGAAAPRPPTRALVVLAAVLVGFGLGPLAGIPTYLVAVAGAVLLAIPALVKGRIGGGGLLRAVNVPFLAFVAALLIVVDGAVGQGPTAFLAERLPRGTSFLALLALTGIAAALACLINNLPAVLVLLAALGAHPGAGPVLAVLIGVNIGPNLTYPGSLALLLWRRVLRRHQLPTSLRRFTTLGVATVPACLLAGTAALWLVLQI